MDNSTLSIQEIWDQLSPKSQRKVLEFARQKLDEEQAPDDEYIGMSWAGGLKEFRDQYTSLELQKKSLDWRIESAMKGLSDPDTDS